MRLKIGIWLILLGIKVMPRTNGLNVANFLLSGYRGTIHAKDLVKPVNKGEHA